MSARIFDPLITAAATPGCGKIAAVGRYYSKVFNPRELASIQFQIRGPLAGLIKVLASNVPKDVYNRGPGSEVEWNEDRWSHYDEVGDGVGAAGTFTVATAERTPDTDDLEFARCAFAAAATHTAALATAAALPACTASGSGVGKTLTASANGVLTVDGTAVALNDDILVKNQQNAKDNGFYRCTTAGTAGAAFVLTRRPAFDAASECVTGATFSVTGGSTQAGKWVLAAPPVLIRVQPQCGRIRLQFDVTTADGEIVADAYVRGS